jgi:hypothetical protein
MRQDSFTLYVKMIDDKIEDEIYRQWQARAFNHFHEKPPSAFSFGARRKFNNTRNTVQHVVHPFLIHIFINTYFSMVSSVDSGSQPVVCVPLGAGGGPVGGTRQ